jgi:hypothetical protein
MTTLHGPAAVNQCFLGIQSLVINSLLAVQVLCASFPLAR